jgi:dTDP-4-amino-4,6-dideoxygalactose transaminase
MSDKKIPILDLQPELQELGGEIFEAVKKVINSGLFIMGPDVAEFEKEVASYLGTKHAIACNSGTDALFIALKALDLKPGDEVITSPFTFFATAEAISHHGAIPVFVDIDSKTYNLDPAQIEKMITPKTKGIIPVHIFGQCCEMNDIQTIAKKHKLWVLEDVAQAFGSDYKGKKGGTIGEMGAFSFFPSKNLGCYGDGGLITTDRDDLAQMSKMLRVHGAKKKYYNEIIGYNSRLDTMQAAVLRVKLKQIDRYNTGRREAAKRYNELLMKIPGVTTPAEASYTKHVYHQYTIRVAGGKRDQVVAKMEERGIGTMVYYPLCVADLPVYKDLPAHLKKTPKASEYSHEVMSLPIWPQITGEIQQRVVNTLKECL